MRKLTLFVCLLQFVVILGCTAFQDKRSWEKAFNANTIDSYETYKSEFPRGKYIKMADSSIQIIFWNDAISTNSYEEFERYLIKYPNGFYKQAADSLFEETLWESAHNTSNMELYIKYNEKIPEGRYISKVRAHIDRYLVECNHAGFFKVGMSIPSGTFNNFNISIIKEERLVDVSSDDYYTLTRYFVYEQNNKVMELIEEDGKVFRIDILSDKFRTKSNIGIDSPLELFIQKYPEYYIRLFVQNHDGYEWYEYPILYVRAKTEAGINFELPYEDLLLKDTGNRQIFEVSHINNNSKITAIYICESKDDYSFDKEKAEYIASDKAYAAKISEVEQLREKDNEINKSYTNTNVSKQNNSPTKSYIRSYRDRFQGESSVHEFLGNHLFVATDGSKISYSPGELIIRYSGEQLQFTNIEVVYYNQDYAKIRAMYIGNGSYVSFRLNSLNGTVADNDGTIYSAVN